MAFVLTASGLLMIVVGARGTYAQFGQQVVSDFTGPGNFTYWLASLGAVGALGYVEAFREFSRWFMALIIIGMILSNKGFFAKFTAALKGGPTAPNATTQAATPTQSPNAAPGYLTPQQGVQSGKAGVGIDWLAPFKKFFGG